MGNPEKAMGLLYAFEAPSFWRHFTPEYYVLKSLIYKDVCHYREALAVVEEEAEEAAAEEEMRRRAEAEAQRKAEGRKKTGKTPAPPKTWIARSSTHLAVSGPYTGVKIAVTSSRRVSSSPSQALRVRS